MQKASRPITLPITLHIVLIRNPIGHKSYSHTGMGKPFFTTSKLTKGFALETSTKKQVLKLLSTIKPINPSGKPLGILRKI
jgi:hypothetical protein